MRQVILELNQLMSDGVIDDYAIGGGAACMAYVPQTMTDDLDVFVVVTAPQSPLMYMQPVWQRMSDRGYEKDPATGKYLIGGVKTDFLPLPQDEPNIYRDALTHARVLPIDGQSARVVGPEHLAVTALSAPERVKQFGRVTALMNYPTFDRPRFDGLVKRFDDDGNWEKYENYLRLMNDER